MCGRFACSKIPKVLAELLDAPPPPDFVPRLNIAPSLPVCALIRDEPSGRAVFDWLRWGLVPGWARDPQIGARMFNARAETAAEKPAFRAAFRRRRCLIPADGFYEWHKDGRLRTPYYIDLPDVPMVLAGLWETWSDPQGGVLRSCAILTVDANEAIRPLHDRMPVILPPAAWAAWMNPQARDPAQYLRPYPSAGMRVEQAAPPENSQFKLVGGNA